MSSAKSAGTRPDNDWCTRHVSLYFTSGLSYQRHLYICLYRHGSIDCGSTAQ